MIFSLSYIFLDSSWVLTSACSPLVSAQLQCCGVRNITSWSSTTWGTSHNGTVPLSCCKNSTSTQCTGRLDQPDLLNVEVNHTEAHKCCLFSVSLQVLFAASQTVIWGIELSYIEWFFFFFFKCFCDLKYKVCDVKLSPVSGAIKLRADISDVHSLYLCACVIGLWGQAGTPPTGCIGLRLAGHSGLRHHQGKDLNSFEYCAVINVHPTLF